ncbi:HNH endonuclease signature motif containing protein [Metapseudomonas resinovorans]|uniref:HNH endonuclease signature motif containing protein n=1 Tax=Metapseudomonas resinovorans TaxID=53412 RepID=UPI00048D6E7A|nr:HNH endonuclease signature motif containing protein [Pseudomonas resinovorans]
MPRDRPPPSNLGDILRYDPVTGDFFWKILVSRMFPGDKAGTLNKYGYMVVRIGHRSCALHRLAFALMDVDITGMQVDHINGIRHDNRWENLRAVTPSENARNMKKPKNNSSGVIGVCWCTRDQKWQVYAHRDKKPVFLGKHQELFEAVAARKSAELRFGYHENHGR